MRGGQRYPTPARFPPCRPAAPRSSDLPTLPHAAHSRHTRTRDTRRGKGYRARSGLGIERLGDPPPLFHSAPRVLATLAVCLLPCLVAIGLFSIQQPASRVLQDAKTRASCCSPFVTCQNV